MSRFLSHLVAACLCSLLPSGAFAGVIYDQTVDLTLNAALSDFAFDSQAAEDFQLQPGATTITDVHWWGVYSSFDTPTEPDDFTIRFYADAAGSPVINPFAEFAVGDVGRVDTGVDVANRFDVYAYSADIPALSLVANTTYWLSIVNDTTADTDDNWYWSFELPGDARQRSLDGEEWHFRDIQLGFQLTDDALAVPEPASLALFAAGLAGLCALGWNRRKTGHIASL